MADWQSIQKEYITMNTSYRRLAAKYGVTYNEIGKRSRKEGWRELKEKHHAETMTQILEADKASKAEMARRLNETAAELLDKVQAYVKDIQTDRTNTQEFRQISGTLKDIKDVLMIRSEEDLREQEARIANLMRSARQDEQNSGGELIVEGLPEEFRR